MHHALFWLSVLLVQFPAPLNDDSGKFLRLLETSHARIQDLNCEFEGEETSPTSSSEGRRPEEDTLRFSGSLSWRSDRHAFLDLYLKSPPQFQVTHEKVLVVGDRTEMLMQSNERPEDAVIMDSRRANIERPGSVAIIFLVDTLRRILADPNFKATHEGTAAVEGRNCEVLRISFRENDRLYQRFWIDMERGGHPIKREFYLSDDELNSRTVIELKSFPVGKETVWLPMSGVAEGFATLTDDMKPAVSKTPTTVTRLYIVPSTVKLNRGIPKSAFTLKYKPGTPVNDQLRQLQYQYGQQLVNLREVTRDEAEKMLRDQLKAAEVQEKELLANATVEDPEKSAAWASWTLMILGGAVLTASLILVWRNR